METGDTYMEARDLLEQTLTLLESSRPVELDPSQVAQELAHLIEEDKVQQIDTKIFDNSLFFAEEGIRSHLVRILEKRKAEKPGSRNHSKHIASVEEELGIQYDSIQNRLSATLSRTRSLSWQVDLVQVRRLLSMELSLFMHF